MPRNDMDLPMTSPRPPAELWGLWTVTRERPEGFWWNHNGSLDSGEGTPMTFVSKADALASAKMEQREIYDDEVMVVARIGVAPAEVPA